MALQKHMGLPVVVEGQRCSYNTPLSTGRRCHHQRGLFSDYFFTCAQGLSIRRHNRVHDAWIALCRQAGWHTDVSNNTSSLLRGKRIEQTFWATPRRPEQQVFTSPGETNRADFLGHTPAGQSIVCDVMITAAPTLWDEHGTHSNRSAAIKTTSYSTTPWGYTHDRAKGSLFQDAHTLWLCGNTLRLLHCLSDGKCIRLVAACCMVDRETNSESVCSVL